MLVSIAPPDETPVSLAEAKAQVRLEASDTASDTILTAMILAATAKLGGERGLLGRALITQEWRLVLDAFPAAIVLPLPPCQSVESVSYVDVNGATQTLDPSAYTVSGIGGTGKARIVPGYGTSWPSTRAAPEAVKIEFTAGYGDDPDDVPADLRQALLLHIGHLFEHRELSSWQTQLAVLPEGYDDLIAGHRLWGFGA